MGLAEEVGEQRRGLAGAVLQVDGLEDGEGVFEQEGGVVSAAVGLGRGAGGGLRGGDGGVVGVVGEEGKDLEFAADPEAGSGEEVRGGGELDGGWGSAVLGDAV